MPTKIDVTADIIPAESIGNIRQGDLITNYEDVKFVKNINPFLSEYSFQENLKLIVNKHSKICEIIAHSKYLGTINNKIHLGMSIEKLLTIENSFDGCHGGLMSSKLPGICIYITENFDADIHCLETFHANKILGIGLISQFNENGNDLYSEFYGENYFNKQKINETFNSF